MLNATEARWRARAQIYQNGLDKLRNTYALLASALPRKGKKNASLAAAFDETVREIDATLEAGGARNLDKVVAAETVAVCPLTVDELNALAWADGRRLDARGRTDPEPHAKTLAAAVRRLAGGEN